VFRIAKIELLVPSADHGRLQRLFEGVAHQHSLRRIRELVRTQLPPGGTVPVVSRGDDKLLRFERRTGSPSRRAWTALTTATPPTAQEGRHHPPGGAAGHGRAVPAVPRAGIVAAGVPQGVQGAPGRPPRPRVNRQMLHHLSISRTDAKVRVRWSPAP
jgi:hypothetical protein